MIQTSLYSFSYKKGSVVPWCKRCGAENFYRAGKSKSGMQRYRCKRCGFRFVWTSDLPRRNYFSNVIAFAAELYGCAGISLRTIARKLKKYFDIKVSHEGVRKWVIAARAMRIIDDDFIATRTWHCDETYIRIKGQGRWLWVVYCRESKQVIAWHISKKRLITPAMALLRKAMKQSKGVRPERIITDGLWQYRAAIRRVIGWNWRVQKKRHVIDSGFGKNGILERVNREIKRRVKWFGTFQALEGAEAFFNLFFYHFNHVNSLELT
jgi:transposase-like protein/predicted RNA-binding Zn-ribbon protein involved in translation (DUF1610 family)